MATNYQEFEVIVTCVGIFVVEDATEEVLNRFNPALLKSQVTIEP